jgi:hypothetical protein
MLFSLRSIVLFSSLMAVSEPVVVVGAVPVPSEEPVVTPGAALVPDDWAVPALLVPGAVAAPDGLVAPRLPADEPLELWAMDGAVEIRTAIATIAAGRIIGKSPFTP